MLKRTDLKQYGDPVLSATSSAGKYHTGYYLVTVETEVVGVGIFHDNHTDCTIAIVRDEDGEKSMLGNIVEEYPIDSAELLQLLHIYQKNF